jgi:uncharacterized protein (TIGR02145 family)
MRYLITIVISALSLNAVGQTNPNYNPDYDANGSISVNDLLGFLSIFGDTWDSVNVIMGCTYSNATDYNPLATMDDGSCTFLPDCAGDECGVCGGSGIADGACDCDGNVLDECGVCGGDNSTCTDCCGVVNGDGSTCDGACGACNDDTSCLDDCGVPNGDNSCLDECGVPNGDNSTCLDECGVVNGDNSTCLDECGVPNGDNSTCFAGCGDGILHEGYDYPTVQIGDQCWFSKNCRYLPEVSPSNDGSYTDPYYYVYDYQGTDITSAQATSQYYYSGVLYNWSAVMTEGICPSGWHVPTDGEFTQLTNYLGGQSVAGDAMKATSGWNPGGDLNGSNSSGFNGLPGGQRSGSNFSWRHNNGFWWSSSAYDSNFAYARRLQSYTDYVVADDYSRSKGFSARCLMDYTDECGVPNGDNSCLDDCGVPNGDNSSCLDECGVPNGDNSTCLDECGVVNGDNSTCFTGCGDGIMHDGHDYSTVQIGVQCWFSENCRYLPAVSPSNEGSDTAPYYYVYGYQGTDVTTAQATSNYSTYGVLYNWTATITDGLCPSGWHVPSDGEFTLLTDYLGGEFVAGDAMKSTSGWSENGNGSNSSGFTGLPGGNRDYDGNFFSINDEGYFYSSSAYGGSRAWSRLLNDNDSNVESINNKRRYGMSVRCLQDYTDECGVPNGDNSTCLDCCGVVNGDGSTCDGACGACGDDTSCLDECGVPNGDDSCLDDCGVPNGDNSTCLDECGVPNGDNSTCFTGCGDGIMHDGHDYSTVQIGEQCWFAENCRYLPEVSWLGSHTDPYYCVYDYEGTDIQAAQATANYETYGVLYNWPAVMTEGICPSGWHIPTDLEWQTMEVSLGMSQSEAAQTGYRGSPVGDYMKSTSGWNDGGFWGGGSNSSGFTGPPGGARYPYSSGGFQFKNIFGIWWSASESGSNSWGRSLTSSGEGVSRNIYSRDLGFSARCVRDYTDECGVLNGDNSTCLDECGVINGDNSSCADDCGVPNGDNSTCGCDGVPNYVISHDGYDYSTVQIDDKCWFAENCRYLPNVSPSSSFSDTTPYYYVYDYQGTDVAAAQATINYETYGVLYNWPAIMTEDICPSGWHVPSDGEFTQLTDYLGGNAVAGAAMKSATAWDGTNSSGFNGLPAGIAYSGDFGFSGSNGYWWSSSASGSTDAWFRLLVNNNDGVLRSDADLITGYSARCIRDYTDECGVLNGDNSTCLDDCGVLNGDNSCLDECGVLNGDNSTCLDECGVPNGDNSTCLDCCGVVNGDGSTCDGNCGACGDSTSCLDECGVPNGDNSTCADCLGVPNGNGLVYHYGDYYSTVQIGDQCWFAENCRYLPSVSPSLSFSETTPYYYVYDYQGTDVAAAQATINYETYGVLYNWPAIMTEDICPSGWHVPSHVEFTQLTDYLGGNAVAGAAMKSATAWDGTNSSGFNGLPGGIAINGDFINGFFNSIGNSGYWWSSSASGESYAHQLGLYNNNISANHGTNNRNLGRSARCVRD